MERGLFGIFGIWASNKFSVVT